jgi:hypothetical protein
MLVFDTLDEPLHVSVAACDNGTRCGFTAF